MTTADRLLARMKQNQVGWRIEQMQTVAGQQGLTWRSGKGDHVVFITPDGRKLTVPAHRPIKPVYVRHFLALLEVER